MALIANRTALFAVFTASSRVTKSFLSSMSVSTSVDEKKWDALSFIFGKLHTHPTNLEPKNSEQRVDLQFEPELVGKNYNLSLVSWLAI